MDPEQVDRPGRHVEPAEPEDPDVEQNLAELKLDGHPSTEVSSHAESEDPAVRDHSGPPLQNLEAEGSDDEADVVQLEPAEVENSGDEADVYQLEPAGVAGSAERIVVHQVSIDERSSRASFSMEEEPQADVDGAEEPGPFGDLGWVVRIEGVTQAESLRRWVAAGQAAITNVYRGVLALEAASVNLEDAMARRREWVDAVQAAIANLRRGARAVEAAAVYFRDFMVGEGEFVAEIQAVIAELPRGVDAVEVVAVFLRDSMAGGREWVAEGQAVIANLRNNAHALE